MKTKKFLFMALLSGVLVLSACDLMSSKKKSDEDEDAIGENFQADDYKGQEGATELSEDDWDKAFSLEETVMHRSVKIAYQAVSSDGTNSMTTEIDHGKMKLAGEVMNQGGSMYVNVNSISPDGQANVTVYGQDNGAWASYTYSHNYRILCGDLGLLEYGYDEFTYDSSSKTYKSTGFTYSAGGIEMLVVTSCEITIKDGFPSKVELVGTSDGVSGTYTANYSNYGKVKVSLPNVNQGGNSGLQPGGNSSQQGGQQGGQQGSQPSGNVNEYGTEITYNQLMSAYRSKPSANFNHAEAVMDYMGMTMTYTANLVNGEWVSEGDSGPNFSSFAPSESDMQSLADASASSESDATITFYQNGSNYVIRISSTDGIEIIYMNQYFYVIREVMESDSMTITINISWSRI